MIVIEELQLEEHESLEGLVRSLNGEYQPDEDIWEQLEKEHPDFTFYQDIHLESLIDTLTENGLTEHQILNFSLALYGPVIDFYKVGRAEDVMYLMAVGQR